FFRRAPRLDDRPEAAFHRAPREIPCGVEIAPVTNTSGTRIGVDVGGTFTDLVAWDSSGAMRSCKVPTTPAAPAAGVLNGLAVLEPATGPWTLLAHGTTLVTN